MFGDSVEQAVDVGSQQHAFFQMMMLPATDVWAGSPGLQLIETTSLPASRKDRKDWNDL
jgi:hypothetical protein